MSNQLCRHCNEPILSWGRWVTYGWCRDCWLVLDQDRFIPADTHPREKSDTQCNWTEWNPETGQYEPFQRTKTLDNLQLAAPIRWMSRKEIEDMMEARSGLYREVQDKSIQELEPPPSESQADTEDK